MPKRRARHPEVFHITREQVAFCRGRIGFLLAPGQVSRPLIDLMANAYTQGLIDASETLARRAADPAPPRRDIIHVGGSADA